MRISKQISSKTWKIFIDSITCTAYSMKYPIIRNELELHRHSITYYEKLSKY